MNLVVLCVECLLLSKEEVDNSQCVWVVACRHLYLRVMDVLFLAECSVQRNA